MGKRKFLFSILFFACVLALLYPISVHAEEDTCPICQQNVAYISIGGIQTETLTLEAGKHYRLSADIAGTPDSGILVKGAGCIDLNGFNITAGENCIAISCNGSTTNIMGAGTITGTYTAATCGAAVHTESSATVNIYGGTFRKEGNNPAVYVGDKCKIHFYDGATINAAGTYTTYPTAVFMEKSGGQFFMHGGTIIGGTTTGNGGCVRVSNGTFTMAGGTISGGQADRGGNIAVNSSGKLTVSGGTITSGTATATYGGGNIYTNKRAVTISGGLITKGVAAGSSYGGGNIGVYRATLNITGGTISMGSANAEESTGGGNLYVEGDIAALNISGGTITGGTTTGSGGNIYMVNGTMTITGGEFTDGIATSNGGNMLLATNASLTNGTISGGQAARGGNIAVRDGGSLIMSGGTVSGGTASETYGGGNIYTNKCPVTINDGLITGGIATGSSYGGGNLGIFKATVTVTGGSITNGRATNSSCRGGGNVYMEGTNAAFNMSGGLVTGGYIATGRGHSIYARSGAVTLGADARITNKAEGTGGSMNLYIHDGFLESAAHFTGGVYVTDGNVSITGGTCYSFYYYGDGLCTITGGTYRLDYSQYVPDGYRWIRTATSSDYVYTVFPEAQVPSAVLITNTGAEHYATDPLNQYTKTYTHMKLYGDLSLANVAGQQLWVDLNGHHLTLSGSGKLYAFDTANDNYNATACGTITAEDTIEIAEDVLAPNNKRYIALTNGTTTMHRLHMVITTVTLNVNNVGISYKTKFYCDDALSAKINNHGIVLSVKNMPGADFRTETGDINRYSVSSAPFQSGAITQSVAVAGIMQQANSTKINAHNGEIPIYANAYVELEGGKILVADTKNIGKEQTSADFTGVAYSLHDAMNMLDAIYGDYNKAIQNKVDAFYHSWKDRGMNWEFNQIGKSITADLVVKNGMGYCPVCHQQVQWTPLDQTTYAQTPYGTTEGGAHVYLTEDITYTGNEGNAFIFAPATVAEQACLHLNGHNLTATKSRAIYGGQGIINVMGNGTVSGYIDGSKYGAAVQISTSSTTGIVNLYSGTYKHSAGAHSGSYVAAVRNYGGTINVYKDAHIDGSYNGNALMTGTSAQSNSTIALFDTVVDGSIYLTGSKNFTTKLIIENTTVNGIVDANSVNTIILRGGAQITTLDLEEETLLTLDSLTDSAKMGIIAVGCFTENSPQAAAYAKYFHTAKEGSKIAVSGNALYCLLDYSAKLELDENQKGYCHACKKNVVWSDSGAHMYLTENAVLNITAPTTCLHLNGHTLTANATIESGVLNIMGGGTVTNTLTVTDSATVSLYSGTYVDALTCCGGTLNLYADTTVSSSAVLSVTNGTLNLTGTVVEGAVAVEGTACISGAIIRGTVEVAADAQVTLTGRPVIENMQIAKGTYITANNLLAGTNVCITAEGTFTTANSNIHTYLDYFTAFDSARCIVVQKDVLSCMENSPLPGGKKILVVGNSMTYYGKYVIDKGHVLPLTTRQNDKGYLYQVCRANGTEVEVTNFTFGGHTLEDFYSGKCAANRGHNGHNHLEDLTDRNYDYVIFQEGSEAAEKTNIYAECKPLMDLFTSENPNTKFLFLVQGTVHTDETAWRSSIKELESHGITVIDWGKLTNDLASGVTTAPGATQTFQKFSFIVNKSAKDGRHPNILAGYIAAQMTYSAITGKTAVGMDYSFWNDTNANAAFKLSSYLKTYYSYDATVPSNTNFEAIFNSPVDMLALQQLIDKYLTEKPYLHY